MKPLGLTLPRWFAAIVIGLLLAFIAMSVSAPVQEKPVQKVVPSNTPVPNIPSIELIVIAVGVLLLVVGMVFISGCSVEAIITLIIMLLVMGVSVVVVGSVLDAVVVQMAMMPP